MMAQPETQPPSSLIVGAEQPLIGVFERKNGREVVRYFVEDETADAATASSATQAALSVIGAWSDLDWDETLAALDHIRHESAPTPPIDDL
jgi:hypothetical protein